MELLDTGILKEIFQHITRIRNMQVYADRISQLHHRYLEVQLLSATPRAQFDIRELASFAEDAEFLADEYTNPLVTERIEGLPIEDVPSRKIVQDALVVAGTIFEFLGDAVCAHEDSLLGSMQSDQITIEDVVDKTLPEDLQALYEQVGRSALLYLKAALCYSLGMYEPRTRVILRNLQTHMTAPSQPLTLKNTVQWQDYLICALLSRNISLVSKLASLSTSFMDMKSQMVTMRQYLRQLIASGDFSEGSERMLLRRVTEVQTNLCLIDACLLYSEAFQHGSDELAGQAQKQLEEALRSIQRIGDYQMEWIIRTLHRVAAGMWADSPWMRLGNIIRRRAYLRKLVEDGIVTLWSSQIAALEMTSNLGPLESGYLDDRVKRVVIHMPTSAGKTLLAQLAIAQQVLLNKENRCIYVGFSRALCDQVAADLAERLATFSIRVAALVSDNELLTESYESDLLGKSSVIVITPEKLSMLVRQRSSFLEGTTLFIFDELHNISKRDRGWTYEGLISLLLHHPSTHDAKMLFLSAVMPNYLTVQEWVDPEHVNEIINIEWQPTRTLKGVVQFKFGKSHIPGETSAEITLPGDLVYVRRKEDANSPLRIEGFIHSKQVLQWGTPKQKTGKTSWSRWMRMDKSENDVSHAAQAAARFARLGPVLVYCPQQADTAKLCDQLVHLSSSYFEPLRGREAIQYGETIEFVRDRLLDGHPLVTALRYRVAFHHGGLPRDVRNEIEFAFEKRWICIMAATTTLAEGVNFPIKTLLLSHYGIPYTGSDGKFEIQHKLSKSDFTNIMGRAGRALHETEGQVVFMQSIIGYPYNADTGYNAYLDLDSMSSDLSIKSMLSDNDLEQLTLLVEAVDSGILTDEEFLFGTRPVREDISLVVDKLQTFTLLLQDQGLVGEDQESFVRIFQGTFLGKQKPNAAQQVLGPFSYRSARAIRSQLNSAEQSLFAQTGLKIITCRKLLKQVQTYWEQKRGMIHTFLGGSLDEDILFDIATIIYGLSDDEIDPKPVMKKSKFAFNHAGFFVEWINNPQWAELHHFHIKNAVERAQIYTEYTHDTLEYKAPWTLSAFWLFSKMCVESLYGIDLISTPLGKELVLLPAYSKFGVNTPAAALFSTLGISPALLARQLASLYAIQHPHSEDRYNYPAILQWILKLQSVDLEYHHFKPSHIRRVFRLLEPLKPLDDENIIQERERSWEMSFWIEGWHYYDGEHVLQTIQQGNFLILKRQPDNPYNPDAVEVFTLSKDKLGYVPDELCKAVARQIDTGPVTVTVRRVRPSDPRYKVYVHCRSEER